MKLPAREDKPAATKRSRAAAVEAGEEERKRQKNVSLVSVLGGEDSSVRMLEELLFGAEDELLGRLVSALGQTRAIERDPGNHQEVPGRGVVCFCFLNVTLFKHGKETIHLQTVLFAQERD